MDRLTTAFALHQITSDEAATLQAMLDTEPGSTSSGHHCRDIALICSGSVTVTLAAS